MVDLIVGIPSIYSLTLLTLVKYLIIVSYYVLYVDDLALFTTHFVQSLGIYPLSLAGARQHLLSSSVRSIHVDAAFTKRGLSGENGSLPRGMNAGNVMLCQYSLLIGPVTDRAL